MLAKSNENDTINTSLINLSNMEWTVKNFCELTLDELYNILMLRNEVFVVEQNCAYRDPDGQDQLAVHVMSKREDRILAYTRIFPAGIAYPEPSIGRVVTSPSARGTGLGKKLMEYSITHCEKLFGSTAITIGAQVYLEKFYGSFGFFPNGDEYLEDGIPHIKMTRKPLVGIEPMSSI